MTHPDDALIEEVSGLSQPSDLDYLMWLCIGEDAHGTIGCSVYGSTKAEAEENAQAAALRYIDRTRADDKTLDRWTFYFYPPMETEESGSHSGD